MWSIITIFLINVHQRWSGRIFANFSKLYNSRGTRKAKYLRFGVLVAIIVRYKYSKLQEHSSSKKVTDEKHEMLILDDP